MHRAGHKLLYTGFFCSGAAALTYETAWTRLLSLTMGHTVASAGAVLAAFMGGLAIGAAIAGRLVARLDEATALRWFAGLEILIAALALGLPLEIAAFRPLLATAYADGLGGLRFAIMRAAVAMVVVSVPAIAMGATLPLLVRWAGGTAAAAASTTARLYASNTFGATAGAVVAGFLLLPSIGLRNATLVAAALNLVSAAMAWRVSRRQAGPDFSPGRSVTLRSPSGEASTRSAWIPSTALALSGAASLVLQLVWTRLLSMLVGPTTYAFSAMAAAFIAGIALGSLTGGWLVRKGAAPGSLVFALIAAGIAAIGSAAWAPGIALAIAAHANDPTAGFAGVMWFQSMLIAGSMLPMTIALGAAFPLAVSLAVGTDRPPAADVAIVYTANTIGAVAGALAGAWLLIPRFGLQRSAGVAALLLSTAAVIVALSTLTRRGWAMAVVFAAAAPASMWLMPSWDRALLSSGAYKYAAFLPQDHRDALLKAGSLLYYREGAASTVSVRRVAGTVSLSIDGKIDASNAGDMLTQRLLAHVPLLLHPNPRLVAIIGLGSGVTLGSALAHPIERADTIEISPEVVEASASFLHENGGALANARSRLIVGDGRSHMTLGRTAYDVVISEPSNPWMAGVAALYTREMFEAIRGRLSPDGLVCQWTHAYDMAAADFRSIVATFADVFPHVLLWRVGAGDVLLVGAVQSIEARLPLIRSGWQRAGVAANLSDVHVTEPDLLLSLVTADEDALRRFAAGGTIQRDDRLSLEFTAPRSAFGRAPDDAVATLTRLERSRSVPDLVRTARESAVTRKNRGRMLLGAEAFDDAVIDLLASLEERPDDGEAVDALIRAAGPAGAIDEVERHLRVVMTQGAGHAAATVGVSRILASRGDFAGAEAVLRPLADAARDTTALEQLASVYADAGDPGHLSAAIAGLRALAPAAESATYFSAVLELMTGRPNEALRIVGDARRRGVTRSRDFTVEASAYAALGRKDDARRSFQAAIDTAPHEAAGYENLATLEADEGNDKGAATHFAEALILDPGSPVAKRGLDAALRRLGK